MTDTQKPVAWVDKRQWEEFSLASWPTHLPAHNVGGDDRTGLYTADQLDAAVRAEREQIGFPEWATDEHIANGILEAAETIVQLVIHNQAHNIAEYTGVIKSHAGTLLTRRAHIAKFLAAAIREGD